MDEGGGRPPGQAPAGGGGVPGWWGWQPELPGRKWGRRPPPTPPEKGVKMFELAQLNLFTPEVKRGGGSHWRFIAMCWQALGLGGVDCGEDLDLDADLVGAHGDGGVRPGGGQLGGVCQIGARHRLPAQVQAQARRNPRKWGPPAAAPPQPPGHLRQGLGGHLPRPGPARHGMLTAFWR